ncbi:hypothetical protein FBEOM_13978 [Fusarium beomiforme]|uniref:Uncharacterized protein n=1 Tax=Fusarium beomiforme TaxID=44412 RepID=A0A9P5DLW9_9HYPO|nr:hypothetical protein FBEOM_13978 [Fusarium beomiforme]
MQFPSAAASDTAIKTSIASATQPTTTATETSTVASSETSIETGTTTTAIVSTTLEAETTTTAEATTTTAEAESTTTTAVATPTFTIVGGGGSVQGQPLKGIDQDGSILIFNPQAGGLVTRTFVLDLDTGRLRDKTTGSFVCAYYGFANTPSDPANVAYCQTGNTGPNMYYEYLTCEIVDENLVCTAPKAACPEDEDGNQTCTTQSGGGVNNQFYYKFSTGAGDYLYISSGNPTGYTSTDLVAQES